jgi:hypothetical protein
MLDVYFGKFQRSHVWCCTHARVGGEERSIANVYHNAETGLEA